MNRPDQQLIADYLAGDDQSLELLIGQYLKPIYSFVFRYVGNGQEAEDITQEVFVRVWRNLKKFDQEKTISQDKFSEFNLMRQGKLGSELIPEQCSIVAGRF